MTLESKLAVTQNLVAPPDWNQIGNASPERQSATSPEEKSIVKSPPPLKQVKAMTKAQYVRDMRRQLLGQDDDEGKK